MHAGALSQSMERPAREPCTSDEVASIAVEEAEEAELAAEAATAPASVLVLEPAA